MHKPSENRYPYTFKIKRVLMLVVISSFLFQPISVLATTGEEGRSASGITSPNGQVVDTPTPTATATSAPDQEPFERPVIVVKSYGSSRDKVGQGQEFDLNIQIYNAGQKMAMNVVATFLSTNATPRITGGVIAVPEVAPDNRFDMVQPMTAGYELWGLAFITVELNVSYTDDQGNPFTEKFNLSIPVEPPRYIAPSATPTITPTPTAGPVERPQLVITNYQLDVAPLQPGTPFALDLEIMNLGSADAQNITMIVGGGSSALSTTEPGGISGGSGEFTNFAPLGSSNIQSIGDLSAGSKTNAQQSLIVNVTTNPGAFPMKISFVYSNKAGTIISDEQVITLLVYSLPSVEISFYRDPNPVFAGQPAMLPLQIVNLGRKSAILGNMTVKTQAGQISNNVILIGTLEAGGYFTLDANLIPDIAGPLELSITVDYSDDFNQPRKIEKILTLDVLESFEPVPEGPEGEIPPGEIPEMPVQEETFWQKITRFFLGLIGLDSSRPAATGEMYPVEGEPLPSDGEVVPVKPLKGP